MRSAGGGLALKMGDILHRFAGARGMSAACALAAFAMAAHATVPAKSDLRIVQGVVADRMAVHLRALEAYEISMRGYVNTENQKNTSCGIFRLGRKPLPRRLVTSFLSALCSGSMPGCLLRSVFGLPLSSRTLSPNLTTQSPGRGVGCLRNGFRALGGVPVKSFPCSYPATRRVPTRRGRPPWRRFSRQARRRTPCRTSAWRA